MDGQLIRGWLQDFRIKLWLRCLHSSSKIHGCYLEIQGQFMSIQKQIAIRDDCIMYKIDKHLNPFKIDCNLICYPTYLSLFETLCNQNKRLKIKQQVMESSRSNSSSNVVSKQISNSNSTKDSNKFKYKKPTILPNIQQIQSTIPRMRQDQNWQYIEDSNNQIDDKITEISQKQILAQIQSYPLLYDIYLKNADQPQIHNKIIYTFLNRPSKSDCPGYIYGFMNFYQHGPYDRKHFIKMGRTKHQIPQVRIVQWQRQDNHQYTQIFTIRSQYNKKLQSLVHLFFNYARRPREINGQRRIQWFYFEDRVLTAAAVHIINEIMYRIQNPQLRITSNLPQQISSNKRLNIDVKQLLKICTQNFKKQRKLKYLQKRLVLVGLDPSILNYAKIIYQEDVLKFKKKTFGNYAFEVSLKKNIQTQYSVETMPLDKLNKTPQNTLIENFGKWVNIFNSKKICIRIVLKQSDLQSSNLIAVKHALDYLQKITDIQHQEFSFCLFEVDVGTTKKDIKQFLQQKYKEQLNPQHLQTLKNSHFHIIEKPDKVGQTIQLSYQQKQIVLQQFKKQSQDNKSTLKFVNPSLNPICIGVSNDLVLDAIQILEVEFSKIENRLKFQNSVDKINKLFTISKIVKQILQSTTTQHSILTNLNKLLEQFGIKIQDNLRNVVKIIMALFCECNVKGNLSSSKLMQNLKIQIKKQQNSLSQLMNVQINKQTQDFYKSICHLLTTMSLKHIDGELKNAKAIACIIGFFEEVKQKYFNNQLQLFQIITKNQFLCDFSEFQNITKLVQKVMDYQEKGVRCNRIYSKLKQFGFKILKQWQNHYLYNKQKKCKIQNKQSPPKLSKREIPPKLQKKQNHAKIQLRQSTEKIQKISSEQTSKSDDKKSEWKLNQKVYQKIHNPENKSKKRQTRKQKTPITKQHQPKQHTLQMNSMKNIVEFSQKIHELDSIMNICKNEFHLDIPQGIQFSNSTIILAKHIFVKDKITLRVQQNEKEEGQKRNKKKYLILLAGSFQGAQKIQLTKQSGWKIFIIQYKSKIDGPRMLIEKHNKKTLQKLKIQNLVDLYEQAIG